MAKFFQAKTNPDMKTLPKKLIQSYGSGSDCNLLCKMTFVSAMLDSPRGPVFLDFGYPGNGELRISRHDLVGIGGGHRVNYLLGSLAGGNSRKKVGTSYS